MLSVYKYKVPVNDYFTLDLPKTARILKAEVQHGDVCMWALVEPGESTRERIFRFTGTGHPVNEAPAHLQHISTFQMRGGELVFHIFEVVR